MTSQIAPNLHINTTIFSTCATSSSSSSSNSNSIMHYSSGSESAASAHSRNSSGASDSHAPLTPASSHRDHVRVASCSSLSSTPPNFEPPDSPMCPSKTVLDDLLEVPGEREDDDYDSCSDAHEAKLSYGEAPGISASAPLPTVRPSLEYDLADGFCSDGELSLCGSAKRRSSGDSASPATNLTSRISRRLPSLSRCVKDKNSSSPLAPQGVRSAPPSRTSSFRIPSLSKPLITHMESRDMATTPPQTPIDIMSEKSSHEELFAVPSAHMTVEEPIDRRALASTPLLPPMLSERQIDEGQSLQSPLQSPTIAGSHSFSFNNSPSAFAPMPTPPLSTKPSIASVGIARSPQLVPCAEIPPIGMTEPTDDKWAAKLGHANFHITPEPYLPQIHTEVSCRRLTEDWEAARKQYLSHAAHTCENYGQTSQTFKFTEKKWAEINAQWKSNHQTVLSHLAVDGKLPEIRPLAESAPLTKMPSLDGPESKGKFPTLDGAEIVGPMVQYAAARIQQRPSKRAAIVKFFSELCL